MGRVAFQGLKHSVRFKRIDPRTQSGGEDRKSPNIRTRIDYVEPFYSAPARYDRARSPHCIRKLISQMSVRRILFPKRFTCRRDTPFSVSRDKFIMRDTRSDFSSGRSILKVLSEKISLPKT